MNSGDSLRVKLGVIDFVPVCSCYTYFLSSANLLTPKANICKLPREFH